MSLLSKKNIKHRALELAAYMFNIMKHKPSDRVRVVILAQGRTGSTLLESLLDSTGHFCTNGELLNSKTCEIFFPAQYINGLSKKDSDKNFIFHVKTYQLTRDRKKPVDPVSFMEKLYNEGFKVIYLKRTNIIKHSLSNVVAEHRGYYHKFNDKKEDLQVSIDCSSFAENVLERVQFSQEEATVLSNIKYYEVEYEEDLENADLHQKTINKILDYLSLERKNATTKHRKINTLPMKDLISNYDEFVDCIKEHGWQKYLDHSPSDHG